MNRHAYGACRCALSVHLFMCLSVPRGPVPQLLGYSHGLHSYIFLIPYIVFMVFIVMGFIVMVYIGMTYTVLAYIVLAYIVMGYIVMAYIGMAYVGIVYILLVYVGMVCTTVSVHLCLCPCLYIWSTTMPCTCPYTCLYT